VILKRDSIGLTRSPTVFVLLQRQTRAQLALTRRRSTVVDTAKSSCFDDGHCQSLGARQVSHREHKVAVRVVLQPSCRLFTALDDSNNKYYPCSLRVRVNSNNLLQPPQRQLTPPSSTDRSIVLARWHPYGKFSYIAFELTYLRLRSGGTINT